jgi:hypothetical protein
VSAPRSSAGVDGARGHGRRGLWRRRGALRVSALELRAAAGPGPGTVAPAPSRRRTSGCGRRRSLGSRSRRLWRRPGPWVAAGGLGSRHRPRPGPWWCLWWRRRRVGERGDVGALPLFFRRPCCCGDPVARRRPVGARSARGDRLISLTPGEKAFCVSTEVERRGRWRQGARAARTLAAAWRAPRLGPRAPGGGGPRPRHRRAGTVAAADLGLWAAAEFGIAIAAAVAAAWSLGGGRRTRLTAPAAARSVVVSVVAPSAGRRERGRWGYRSFFEGLVVAATR